MISASQQLSEKAIIERVLNGEQALYELIVRRLNPYLYKVGRSYNFSHQDTQDLMQDTFVDAYQHLSQFQHRSGFKSWIIRIMLNNCYKKRQKASFKNEVHYDFTENATPMFNQSDSTPANSIQSKELKHLIENAIAAIPEEYRLVLSLREMTGLNTAETAAALGITEANVKVRLSRAKSMLRAILEKAWSPEELFDFNLVYCDAIVDNVMCRIRDIKKPRAI